MVRTHAGKNCIHTILSKTPAYVYMLDQFKNGYSFLCPTHFIFAYFQIKEYPSKLNTSNAQYVFMWIFFNFKMRQIQLCTNLFHQKNHLVLKIGLKLW